MGLLCSFLCPGIPVGARWARWSAGDWRVAAPEVGTWVCRLFGEAVSAGCAWVQLLCSWGWGQCVVLTSLPRWSALPILHWEPCREAFLSEC